ncbi:major intrinsically disordered Notch2-binding receptor 1 [Chanos chanos]|uniref:Major intrinsically disordered Notch2-binding receptor 1 n=1 Tax=Chanos chanos TaxID=29144 RepID=A0A6J2WNW0_CHACN|nr:major intrinsically disordered Notch2-binding receptor 1-like [Chanos chanos]
MAAGSAEDPLVLMEVLEMLGASRRMCVSYADMCVCLSRRFQLQPLLELRSLLYSTACQDPCFPATLFRDRLHTPCANALSAAADVVSLFNLLTHTHTHSQTQTPTTDQSLTSSPPSSHNNQSLTSSLDGKGCEAWDWPNVLSVIGGGTMAESCKYERQRNVFKEEFHNIPPLIPVETDSQSQFSPERKAQKEQEEDVLFVTHENPYDADADAHTPAARTRTRTQRAKHESLDDLQTSTYFGPPGSDWAQQSRAPPTKSHSLDTDTEKSELEKTGLINPGLDKPALDRLGSGRPRLQGTGFGSTGFDRTGLDSTGLDSHSFEGSAFDPILISSVRDALKRLSGRSLDALSDWPVTTMGEREGGVSSIGTQTEFPPDRRALRSLMLSEKFSFDNPDLIAEDDISAIFRFLDDISMCGSMAVLPGEGGALTGNQPGLAEGADGVSPDRRGRLGKLRRLFHSLEGPEEGVRWGVGRLLQRITDLEQRLEPITELRDQLTHILTALQRLEEKSQLTHAHTQLQDGQGADTHTCAETGPHTHTQAGAQRKGMFSQRDSRSHMDSSSSETHKDWTVKYSKEQQEDQQTRGGKRQGLLVQEEISSHFLSDAHRIPLHSCMKSPALRATDRPRVSWSQSELTPLDLQAPESLDLWLDDVCTPASDTLLRRTVTRCSHARTYRITALSVTATVILLLIIIIPISTT